MNDVKSKSASSSATERVERWVRDDVRSMQAYHVPPSEGLLKLDAMENPYEWDEDIRDAWLQTLKTISLNRYPDPAARELVQRLREVMNIPDELDVMLGNGSDELIQIIQMALTVDGRSILAPVPSFVMYEHIARTLRLKFIGVDLNSDFSLKTDRMIETIKRENPACVFIAYPNNPTGNCFSSDAIDEIINATNGLVVIDEAYHAFCGDSYLNRISEFENIVVMRTLSKIGLAGLRLGFMVGVPAWLKEFEKIRLPYNINCLTQASVTFALEYYSLFEIQAQKIRSERTRLYDALEKFDNIEVFPSQANFILLRTNPDKAVKIHEALKNKKILIKNLHNPEINPKDNFLADCLRVTVGSPEQNDLFLTALQKVIQ